MMAVFDEPLHRQFERFRWKALMRHESKVIKRLQLAYFTMLFQRNTYRWSLLLYKSVFGAKLGGKESHSQHPPLNKPTKSNTVHPSINNSKPQLNNFSSKFKEYPQPFASLLLVPQLQDFHIKLLHSSSLPKIKIPPEILILLQHSIPLLKSIEPQHFKAVIDMTTTAGLKSVPESVCKIFVKTIDEMNANKWEWIKQFDMTFLKKIAMRVVQSEGRKGDDEMADALRSMGDLLSVNQIKKIDANIMQRAQDLSLHSVVRYLSIFRQLKKIGQFVSFAQVKILQKKSQLDMKELISASISLLEIGKEQSFEMLQQELTKRVVQKSAETKEVVALAQVLHKYKVGKLKLWEGCHSLFQQVPPSLTFICLAGKYRHFQPSEKLFNQFLVLDPSFNFLQNISEKQWVQVIAVLYGNWWKLQANKQKCRPVMQALINKRQMNGVYKQIQNFMKFLLSQDNDRKNHLIHSYPDDTLSILLSLEFAELIGPCPATSKQQYVEELERRFSPAGMKQNQHLILVEEFIRYKLMSMLHATGKNKGIQGINNLD